MYYPVITTRTIFPFETMIIQLLLSILISEFSPRSTYLKNEFSYVGVIYTAVAFVFLTLVNVIFPCQPSKIIF